MSFLASQRRWYIQWKCFYAAGAIQIIAWPNKWPEGRHDMKRLVTHRFFPLLSLVLFFVAVMHAGITEAVTFHIGDDPTGGDCVSFASWDAKTKTCTLTADLVGDGIEIISNGVTLNGNGHSIRDTEQEDCAACHNAGHTYDSCTGITLNGVSGVTVTHVTVDNFCVGIGLHGVSDAAVTHNTVLNNVRGIYLDSSNQNRIVANYSYAQENGIFLYESWYNTITGNFDAASSSGKITLIDSSYNNIVGNELHHYNDEFVNGIRMSGSHDNTVAGNWIEHVSIGLKLEPYSGNNTVMNNNFVDSVVQAKVYEAGNTFTGNYWSDYDSGAEGCEDGDTNGVCDTGYELDEGEDASANITFTAAAATVEISPNVIKTKTQEKKTITAYIEIPGYAPEEVTVESVRLVTGNGYIWATETPSAVGDYDGDGVPELMVKFNKELVKMILSPGLNEGTVVGALAGNTFKGVVFITLE